MLFPMPGMLFQLFSWLDLSHPSGIKSRITYSECTSSATWVTYVPITLYCSSLFISYGTKLHSVIILYIYLFLVCCLCPLLECMLHEAKAWGVIHGCSPSTSWSQVEHPMYTCWGNVSAYPSHHSLIPKFQRGHSGNVLCFHLNHSKYTENIFS